MFGNKIKCFFKNNIIHRQPIKLVSFFHSSRMDLTMINFLISPDDIDFNPITNANTTLDFSDAISRNCINITVVDDGIPEPEESFTVSLSVNEPYVALRHDSTTIVIEDDDEGSGQY